MVNKNIKNQIISILDYQNNDFKNSIMTIRISNIKFSLVFVLLFALTNITRGQKAEVLLEPKSILIGEHVEMTLQVEAPADAHIQFPVFSDTIHDKIEIVHYGTIDTSYTEDGLYRIFNQKYTVTSFEDGHYPIEPIVFKSIIDNDTLTFETEAQLLSVETVEPDMEAGPKDIKPIINIPWSFSEMLPYILLALLIIAAVLLLIYYLRRRKKKPEDEELSIWERPDVPAYAAALSKLEALRKSNYLKEEKFKLFHSELTDILRRYIEKQFGIDAPEMVSDEILSETKKVLNVKEHNKLKEILILSDLVKFAKHKPIINDSEQLLKYGFEIVKNTIPVDNEKE